jgi:hypothetical protein
MNKTDKQMEKYIKSLCKEADVFYDKEFGSHLDDEKFNELFREDVQKELDRMVENGIIEQDGDKYFCKDSDD